MVLIVTPKDEDVSFYRVLLEALGSTVLHADGPADALAKARAHGPDVIVTELFQQTDDGWLTPELLKGDPNTCAIPLIAVTAWAMPEHKERARRSGCDVVMIKPVTPRDLVQTISWLIG